MESIIYIITLLPYLVMSLNIMMNRGKTKRKRWRTHSEGDDDADTKSVVDAMHAAQKGHLERLKQLRREGRIDLLKVDYDHRSVLHMAVENNHLEVVRYLIKECGVSHNVQDRWSQNPLSAAKKKGYAEIVKFLESCDNPQHLVETNEDDGAVTEEEAIAYKLCDAAARGNILCLKEFKKKGVDLSQADYDGRTALHLACNEGQVEVVKFLLTNLSKESTHVFDKFGNTPMGDAEKSNNAQIVAMLREFLKPEPQPVMSGDPEAQVKVAAWEDLRKAITEENEPKVKGILHLAVKHRVAKEILVSTEEQCKEWQKAGKVQRRSSSSNNSMIMGAKPIEQICFTKSKTFVLMRTVLEAICQFDAATASDIMEILIRQNKYKVLELFLENTKADPNATGQKFRRPLHTAIEMGNVAIVGLLLRFNADVDEVPKHYNVSPIIYLIRNTKLKGQVVYDMLEQLLGAGANPNALDNNHGLFPIHYVIQSARPGMEMVRMIRILLKYNAKVDSVDRVGLTALQYAAGDATHRPSQTLNEKDRYHIVKFLSDRGSPLNHRSNDGNTVLHIAAKSNCLSVVNHLLEKGIDCSLKNVSDYSAADIAQEGSQVRKLLLQQHYISRMSLKEKGDDGSANQSAGLCRDPRLSCRAPVVNRVPCENTEDCSFTCCVKKNIPQKTSQKVCLLRDNTSPMNKMTPAQASAVIKEAIVYLSERVGDKFPKLLRRLNKDMDGLKAEALLQDLQWTHARDGLEEMVYQGLHRWWERVGYSASVETLKTVLRECNMPKLEKAFEQRFISRCNSKG